MDLLATALHGFQKSSDLLDFYFTFLPLILCCTLMKSSVLAETTGGRSALLAWVSHTHAIGYESPLLLTIFLAAIGCHSFFHFSIGTLCFPYFHSGLSRKTGLSLLDRRPFLLSPIRLECWIEFLFHSSLFNEIYCGSYGLWPGPAVNLSPHASLKSKPMSYSLRSMSRHPDNCPIAHSRRWMRISNLIQPLVQVWVVHPPRFAHPCHLEAPCSSRAE